MRSLMWMVCGTLWLSGCAGAETAKLKDDVEALKRRVAALEKESRGGAPKGAKAGKAKGGKSPAKAKSKTKGGTKAKADPSKAKTKAPPGPVGTVVVQGDAAKVALDNTRRIFDPGPVPVGDYALKAAFGDEPELTKVLDLTVAEGVTLTVTCDAATKSCVIAE